MIRRISHIKAFGVFGNFQWPSGLPEFKQFNLIYGWNYSGKTTLSRIFRCFELRQLHPDFADAQAQFKRDDGTVYDLSRPETAPVFRVFNSDFVRTNLAFDEGCANPILVLGAEDIAKQQTLKEKKTTREALAFLKGGGVKKIEEQERGMDNTLQRYARDFIKKQLSRVNYDRRSFEPKVNECKAAPEKYVLDETKLAECLAVYRSTSKKPALAPVKPALTSAAYLKDKAGPLLARKVTGNTPIQRLKDDPNVEKWVNEGRPLHEKKTACQFCDQPLPSDLMAQLAKHFSAEYENLMTELAALKIVIQASQGEEIELPHKTDFYPELSERFVAAEMALRNHLKHRATELERLAASLTEKQTKAFTAVECPTVDDPAARITAALGDVNNVVGEHNKRTTEFENERTDAFAKLERHYAATFVRDEKYNEELQEIANLRTAVANQTRELAALETEIRKLEEALSEAVKGAEKINALLVAYFGKGDLQIRVSEDKKFQIHRHGVVAKNLSDGEKTAIAFAYFITRVQDGRHPLADTRIVIDDPISSLDANHLFNTYALIKTQLAKCRQLFISTHSFEFFNLIREWVGEEEETKKPQAQWKKWGVFFVKRTDSGESVLEEIPKELLKFKSEYHYLFSTLYHFDKSGGKFEVLLSLPNVVRRLMEAFGGIMIPRATGLKGKMEQIFADEVTRERVWKFINHYSHNTTITRSLTIPDTSECQAVVRACLQAIKDWDATYYTDLETEVN